VLGYKNMIGHKLGHLPSVDAVLPADRALEHIVLRFQHVYRSLQLCYHAHNTREVSEDVGGVRCHVASNASVLAADRFGVGTGELFACALVVSV
jgi:hypothetical protein